MKGLWVIAVTIGLATTLAGPTSASETKIKDKDGTTLAVLVVCNSCRSGGGDAKKCHSGVEDGWNDGHPCGTCLLKANPNTRFTYPYDLHITGKLFDPAGAPVKNHFVKTFLANGWGVRTRSIDDGSFRLTLGAIAERKSNAPLQIDVGTQVESRSDKEGQYAIYMLPDGYTPCPDSAAPKPEEAEKPKAKKKK